MTLPGSSRGKWSSEFFFFRKNAVSPSFVVLYSIFSPQEILFPPVPKGMSLGKPLKCNGGKKL